MKSFFHFSHLIDKRDDELNGKSSSSMYELSYEEQIMNQQQNINNIELSGKFHELKSLSIEVVQVSEKISYMRCDM